MPIGSSVKVQRYSNQQWQENHVSEMLEHAVTLSVNGKNWLTFLCLPEDLENLAVGFLFNEDIIQEYDEVISTHVCENNSLVEVWLSHAAQRPRKWAHTSGCAGGMTRGLKINPVQINRPYNPVTPASIIDSMNQLYTWQAATQSVRGLHCSALSDGTRLLYASRDVGRHNTLDKIAGMFLKNMNPSPCFMALTTGRITSEMLTKCARMGTAIVISRTTPSQLAVKMADLARITLIGHVEQDAFNVFTHPETISTYPASRVKSQVSDQLSASPPLEFYPQEY